MIKRKILVADDSAEARSAIERILVRAGYEVIQATSGRQALFILQQRKVDCILLDHLMPEFDGLQTAREIKKDEKLRIIPIIMLTGLETEDAIIAGLSAGADDYVAKTSLPEIIIARVESMLRLGKLQRDLFEKNILLERANADLRNLDMLKSEFVATVSHELRTPLSITKEGLKLILEEVTGCINQQQRELLEVARSNIDRLGKIINDILDISKIEAGKLSLHKSLVDMNPLLHNLFFSYKRKAEAKSIKFTLDIPNNKIKVYMDGDRISQVLTNLISNALKFTNEGGSVKIKLEDGEKELTCSVEDTGIGIAASETDKIFDKFQQFSRASAGPGEKGTGLGLSIARKIIGMHKGRIWAESELNKGSKFIFCLPKHSLEDILKEYIKAGIQDAQEKMSKFTVFSIVVSVAVSEVFMCKLEDCIKNTLRRSGDNTLIYKNKIIVFLSDTNKKDAEAVKKKIIRACDKCISGEKDLKQKVNFNAVIATYPEDILSEEDFIQRIMR